MAKIVIITSRFPFPLEKGDKLRIYNQIMHLGKNHEVYLIALDQKSITAEQLEKLAPHCKSITTHIIPVYKRLFNLLGCFFNFKPFQVQYFFSSSVKKKITKTISQIEPDIIYSHLIRTSEYVKDISGVSKTLDYMDCFSRGYELRINQTSNWFMRIILRVEYNRLVKYETAVFDKFDHHIIISAQDREHIQHPLKENIEIVANGVDFSIFLPMNEPKKYQVLFTGNMGYPPNIAAAHYAATKVIPLLTKKYPQIKLLIAGINPPAMIKKLESKHVKVIAQFEHIRLAFAQSEINLVPAVTSIGLQNKILQAMAMKIPTVTNTAGARGISIGQEAVLMIGNTPEEMATHISFLLDNKEKADTLAEKAYNCVKEKFSWHVHNEKLQQILLS